MDTKPGPAGADYHIGRDKGRMALLGRLWFNKLGNRSDVAIGEYRGNDSGREWRNGGLVHYGRHGQARDSSLWCTSWRRSPHGGRPKVQCFVDWSVHSCVGGHEHIDGDVDSKL